MKCKEMLFGGAKTYSQGADLQSLVIDWMRFPMAIAVVFIHSFGSPPSIDFDILHNDPISLTSIYNFIRIMMSKVITHTAVPTFFMFSGYLFFYKMKEWNMNIYKGKLQKRFKTLLIPYLLWITLFVLMTECMKMGGILLHGKSLSELWQYIIDNGGLRMYWDSNTWGYNYCNWLGMDAHASSPILVPMWFVRDLIVVIFATPVIQWCIKKLGIVYLLIMMFCYISSIWPNIHGLSKSAFFWFSIGAYLSLNKLDMIVTLRKYSLVSYVVTIVTMIPLVWRKGWQ